jgi:hypothetical protein
LVHILLSIHPSYSNECIVIDIWSYHTHLDHLKREEMEREGGGREGERVREGEKGRGRVIQR